MPMHDWKRVESGIYHDFHGLWLMAIRHALNNGLLPPSYYAINEQVAEGWVTDVLMLQGPRENGSSLPSDNGAPKISLPPPAVGLLERGERSLRKRSGRRVTVRHVSNHKVVAVIELVSPGNKESNRDYAQLVKKAVDLLNGGIHVFVIDPFPPPAHHPTGLHASIWQKLTKRRKGRTVFTQPADRPLLAASYSSGLEMIAALQPFAVGEPVPAMPLYLGWEGEEYVTVPLEATYAAAWPEVPKIWRDVLEG